LFFRRARIGPNRKLESRAILALGRGQTPSQCVLYCCALLGAVNPGPKGTERTKGTRGVTGTDAIEGDNG
ncbi:MAG: hypothetical protein ACQESR_02855, partial [Planctomycetota bacterium]